MANRDFADFVSEKNQEAKEPKFDRQERLRSWLDQIKILYDQVKDFLSPFIEKGDVRLEERTLSMNEELLGQYDAPRLLITIGAVTVELCPVGALIFGAHGRVDLRGPRDNRKIVLVPKNSQRVAIRIFSEEEARREDENQRTAPELTWKFSLGPRQDYIELNRDSFTSAIMDVSR